MNSPSIPSFVRVQLRHQSLPQTKSKKKRANTDNHTPSSRILPMQRTLDKSCSTIPKPLRPLTAYHIFFQIEREYIIQTAAGPDADKSIHDNKSYLPGVPRRYRCTKLLLDWYAGPGKRQKRKHRKSHGKIGFLELSRVISKRWATLEVTDPETKRFVTRIAARELAQYKVEMKEYKDLTANVTTAPVSPAVSASVAPPSTGQTISPSSSPPASPIRSVFSSCELPMPALSMGEHYASISSGEEEEEVDYSIGSIGSIGNCMPSPSMLEEEAVDYSICSVSSNGHYIPSPGPIRSDMSNLILPDGSICDPLFELDDKPSQKQVPNNRCVSPASTEMDTDIFCETAIFQPLL
ncbi:hypothetical protein ACHAWF_009250 [Thalassiosira exigua]